MQSSPKATNETAKLVKSRQRGPCWAKKETPPANVSSSRQVITFEESKESSERECHQFPGNQRPIECSHSPCIFTAMPECLGVALLLRIGSKEFTYGWFGGLDVRFRFLTACWHRQLSCKALEQVCAKIKRRTWGLSKRSRCWRSQVCRGHALARSFVGMRKP